MVEKNNCFVGNNLWFWEAFSSEVPMYTFSAICVCTDQENINVFMFCRTPTTLNPVQIFKRYQLFLFFYLFKEFFFTYKLASSALIAAVCRMRIQVDAGQRLVKEHTIAT